jgi:hypothetical protein
MNSPMDELLKHSAHMVSQKRLTLDVRSQEQKTVHRRLNKRIAFLCLSLVICFSVVMLPLSPKVLAYVVNLLKSNEHFQQVVEKGLSTSVGKGVSNQGITLNVENLYVDQGELVFDMVQTYTKELAYKPVLNTNDVQLFINGKKLAYHSGGEFHTLPDGRYGGIIYYTGAYNGNYDYDGGPKLILPEEFKLTIKVDKIEKIQGDWTIEFPVSRKLSEQVTRTYEPAVSNKVNDITITVSKVVCTPLSISIDYEITVPENYSLVDPTSIRNIQVQDEKGNIMTGDGSIRGLEKKAGKMKTFRFTGEYHTPKELPEQLVIIPQRSVEERRTDSGIYYRGEAVEELIFNVPLRK